VAVTERVEEDMARDSDPEYLIFLLPVFV